MNIASHFSALLKRIDPTPRDKLIYQTHEKTVRKRLESVFRTNRVIRVGSYSRGTSIRHTSDVDVMLVLERDEVRWGGQYKSSTTVLNSVRAQLSDRYFQTGVRRDRQAVVVQFRNNQYPVDIVPATYHRHDRNSNYPIFIIPDGNGGWLETSPLAHNKFIKDADEGTGGKLKRTAKLIKYWRYCREPHIPLNSFHVELLLADENICAGAKSYALCFNNALAALANRGCKPLEDPVGISGLIVAANTEPMRRKVQAAVLASAQRAYNAVMAEREGNVSESLRLWEIVFNHRFAKG
jgi:predicted nucleotidyltransferase